MREGSPDEVDIEDTFQNLYSKCVDNFGWSLKDIDDTNIETLIDFIFHKSKPDPDIRIIGGKVYKRAIKPPSWL